MAQTDRPVTLSVLDRLLDFEPGVSTEPPPSRPQSVADLRSAVRRDLEWLLNSRRIVLEPDHGLSEVRDSVYVLGLADITSFSLSDTKERARLLRHMQSVISQFEARLVNVRISQRDDAAQTGSLRFRIEAALVMDPAPERISFDTALDLAGGDYVVREES
jgi:type VI secretion system protein ImpF